MRTLITQSLLSAWGWMFDAPEDFRADARSDFFRVLNREPTPQTRAMLNGINFENMVYQYAETGTDPVGKWARGAREIGNRIRGAQIQVRMKREISVNGNDYLVYGIADAIRAGVIYDVKFFSRSIGSADLYGKYLESPQHPAYFYLCPEAEQFEYLVSDGWDLYREIYEPQNCIPISQFIENFGNYLESENLMDLYREKWGGKK